SFFAPDSKVTDLAAIKAQAVKDAQSVNGALAIVQADESDLRGVDQRLLVLQFVSPASGAAIAGERQRLKTALDGLKQADEALTALQAALPADYEVKTFAHLQKGYDAAIKSLKG